METFAKATRTRPSNYTTLAIEDRIFHMGGICFNASQCRDFYNGKILEDGSEIVQKRALAYEAEFLHAIAQSEAFEPNDWQQSVLRNFPNGIASVQSLLYKRKSFMGVS